MQSSSSKKTRSFLISFAAAAAMGILTLACQNETTPLGGSGGANGNASGGCSYGGSRQTAGKSFPSMDGCNTCLCTAGGDVACTEIACAPGRPVVGGPAIGGTGGAGGAANDAGAGPVTCPNAGQAISPGTTVSATDGCNTCVCTTSGLLACTKKACPPVSTDAGPPAFDMPANACVYAGKTVASGSSFPSTDGCNTCSCAAGRVACTLKACPPPAPAPDAGRPNDASPTACLLSAPYDFGAIGGLRVAVDRSFLTPPLGYRHTRTPVRGDAPELSCAPPLPACGADGVTVMTIERLVTENADVKAALAAAKPPLFGRDSRPVDGTVLEFKRGDGHGLLVGDACNTTSSSCQPIPPGVAELAKILNALDKQQLATRDCKAFNPAP